MHQLFHFFYQRFLSDKLISQSSCSLPIPSDGHADCSLGDTLEDALRYHCDRDVQVVWIIKQAFDSALALASGQAVCKLCKGWNKFSIPEKKILQVAANGKEKAVVSLEMPFTLPHHCLLDFEIFSTSKEAVIIWHLLIKGGKDGTRHQNDIASYQQRKQVKECDCDSMCENDPQHQL